MAHVEINTYFTYDLVFGKYWGLVIRIFLLMQ